LVSPGLEPDHWGSSRVGVDFSFKDEGGLSFTGCKLEGGQGVGGREKGEELLHLKRDHPSLFGTASVPFSPLF
jgi:hypothetical protein